MYIIYHKLYIPLGFPDGSVVKNLPDNTRDTNLIPGSGIHLWEKEMATHSSPSCHKRVRHNLVTKQQAFAFKKQVKVKVSDVQSCLPLCDPMDCSPPDSFVHGIFQARILEWIATPFFRGYS